MPPLQAQFSECVKHPRRASALARRSTAPGAACLRGCRFSPLFGVSGEGSAFRAIAIARGANFNLTLPPNPHHRGGLRPPLPPFGALPQTPAGASPCTQQGRGKPLPGPHPQEGGQAPLVIPPGGDPARLCVPHGRKAPYRENSTDGTGTRGPRAAAELRSDDPG